jgi:hypothetical protein
LQTKNKVLSGAWPAAIGEQFAVDAANTRVALRSNSTKLNLLDLLNSRIAYFSAKARAFGSSFLSQASVNDSPMTPAERSGDTSASKY